MRETTTETGTISCLEITTEMAGQWHNGFKGKYSIQSTDWVISVAIRATKPEVNDGLRWFKPLIWDNCSYPEVNIEEQMENQCVLQPDDLGSWWYQYILMLEMSLPEDHFDHYFAPWLFRGWNVFEQGGSFGTFVWLNTDFVKTIPHRSSWASKKIARLFKCFWELGAHVS